MNAMRTMHAYSSGLCAVFLAFACGEAGGAVPFMIVDVPDLHATHCEFMRGSEAVSVAVEVDSTRGDALYQYRICRVPLNAVPVGEHQYSIKALAGAEQSVSEVTCLFKSKLSSGRMQYALGQTMTCTAGGRCSVFCMEDG